MKFRFDAILRLRKNHENRIQKEMALINAHVLKQEDRLRFMNTVETDTQTRFNRPPDQPETIDRIRLYDNFFLGLASQKQRQQTVIHEAEKQRQARMTVLAEAVKNRRILEFIRDRDFEAQRKEQAKRETREMDEIASTLWSRKTL